MTVRSGSRLGPYEIVDLLGAGGMGEVYRARDTRLDRPVAVKVLSDVLSANPSSRARFEREAKAISALNHPHICALHDVGRTESTDFLVLELLEGETLATRLARGALPLAQALGIGSEIADALGAAHWQGIIHRDLKPANVMLTATGVKLLDFGLAKPQPIQMSAAATVTRGPTAEGTIVGTLQYMAPEQLQGLETDARTDIFSLGAILYEMVTGRQAFEASSHASLIARILDTDPPPVSSLLPLTPPPFDQLVRRCLAKDRADRWQSAHDVALQLRWMESQVSASLTVPAATARKPRTLPWLPWSMAGVATAAAIATAVLPRAPAFDAPPMRLDIRLPETARLEELDGPQISPDGRLLAYAAMVEGRRLLFCMNLVSRQTLALPGTDDASFPFWSPDSRALGFFAAESLKQVSVDGGQPRTLAPAKFDGGGTWGPGFILFAPSWNGVIHRIPDTGGKPEPLGMPPPDSGGYLAPQLLSDGRTFIAWERGRGELRAASLDDPGRIKTLETGVRWAIPHQAGYLVYRRGKTVGARPLDARQLEFSGPFVPLAENATAFSVSRSGTIVYRSDPPETRQLTWFRRDGARAGVVGEAAEIDGLGVAPGGRRAAIWRRTGGNVDLWNVDLKSGITARLTNDPALDADAVWSPDGRMLAFSSMRSGRGVAVYLKHLVDGKEELLAEHADNALLVDTWTPDGKFVVARTFGRAIYLVPINGDRKPRLLADTPYVEDQLSVSPDGRWVAFNSDESGRWEVYVAAFPQFTAKRLVSAAGGVQPRWRGDGRELFFLSPSGSMMSVTVTLGPELVTDPPTVLFTSNIDPTPATNQYDVTSDGKRFLALDPVEHRGHTFTFLLNFLQSGRSIGPLTQH
jgi:eukaryotic-like serine/threonine-protein kinase